MRSKAFVMVELFLAVGVLALVGASALSLVSSSLRLVAAAEEERALSLKAEELVLLFIHEQLPDKGEEGGFRWSFKRSDVKALGLESYLLEVEGPRGKSLWIRI